MRHGLVVMEVVAVERAVVRLGCFAFNKRAGVILGADLGATHGTIAVADLAGTCASPCTSGRTSRSHDGPEPVLTEVLAHFDAAARRLRPRARRRCGPPASASPEPVDFASGRPVRPPIMPGWDDFDIRGWFAGRLPGPVLVDNDVNVMALGEYWRSWLDDVDTLLYVKVGTGIGAGLIVGGEVFRGARGAAGDIGHVRVDSPKPVVCDCGNENCLEAVASGRAARPRPPRRTGSPPPTPATSWSWRPPADPERRSSRPRRRPPPRRSAGHGRGQHAQPRRHRRRRRPRRCARPPAGRRP